MDVFISKQTSEFSGILKIPGDKSISHRALIFSALSENKVEIRNLLNSDDCRHTAEIFQALGVQIDIQPGLTTVQGVGLNGLRRSSSVLDVGNSGTSIRLLSGLLAAQNFDSEVTGDASIQRRPMRRILAPLAQMGAKINGQCRNNDDFPPLHISGNASLSGITYKMPIASAQVKSCVMLAALYAEGPTTIVEPQSTRDHTERMLRGFGYPIEVSGKTIVVPGKGTSQKLISESPYLLVPGDISSAAFFLILGALAGKSITIPNVGLNPTRDGLIQVLKSMDANLKISDLRNESGEPSATLHIQSANLQNLKIPDTLIPNLIDEIPILAVAGLFGAGNFCVRKASELRVKESDRIQMIVTLVRAIGGEIAEYPDGFDLMGNQQGDFRDFEIDPKFDHRIAMAAIILAIVARVNARIKNVECIYTSFPNFFECLDELGIGYEMG